MQEEMPLISKDFCQLCHTKHGNSLLYYKGKITTMFFEGVLIKVKGLISVRVQIPEPLENSRMLNILCLLLCTCPAI